MRFPYLKSKKIIAVLCLSCNSLFGFASNSVPPWDSFSQGDKVKAFEYVMTYNNIRLIEKAVCDALSSMQPVDEFGRELKTLSGPDEHGYCTYQDEDGKEVKMKPLKDTIFYAAKYENAKYQANLCVPKGVVFSATQFTKIQKALTALAQGEKQIELSCNDVTLTSADWTQVAKNRDTNNGKKTDFEAPGMKLTANGELTFEPWVTTIGQEALMIPDLTESIDQSAIKASTNIQINSIAKIPDIKKITSNQVVTIKHSAFLDLTTLEEATFPELQYAEDYAFCFCTSLTQFTADNLLIGGKDMFGTCKHIDNVNFPKLLRVSPFMFNNCYKLTAVELSSAEVLDIGAFNSCQQLSTLTLPVCGNFSQYCFAGCERLNDDNYNNNKIQFVTTPVYVDKKIGNYYMLRILDHEKFEKVKQEKQQKQQNKQNNTSGGWLTNLNPLNWI